MSRLRLFRKGKSKQDLKKEIEEAKNTPLFIGSSTGQTVEELSNPGEFMPTSSWIKTK